MFILRGFVVKLTNLRAIYKVLEGYRNETKIL